MDGPFPNALLLSRRALRVLVVVNVVYGVLILALLIASLVAAGPVMRRWASDDIDSATLVRGIFVAYPLWRANTLAGSPAEEMTKSN